MSARTDGAAELPNLWAYGARFPRPFSRAFLSLSLHRATGAYLASAAIIKGHRSYISSKQAIPLIRTRIMGDGLLFFFEPKG